jgi:Flp pilus assembly protein TadG
MSPTATRTRERGQVLALFALAATAMILMVGVVIDGGNAWAQNRIAQNGTDAAAESGATVLAQKLVGATRSDADVRSAVDATAAAMNLTVEDAVYTDINGNSLGISVGSLGGSAPPAGASGVEVTGQRTFGTYFARILPQFADLTTTTRATAITGAGRPYGRPLFPVTPPIWVLTCDGQNRPTFEAPPTHWVGYTFYKVPLCKNGPGNVGWIDWDPPSGGASELVSAITGEEPLTYPIPLPSWQYVAQTGNVNSGPVEDAMRRWDGKVVLFPLFDSTCNVEPPGTLVEDCPPANVGGQGQNQWYHFPEFAAFQLCSSAIVGCPAPHGAYVNGNNRSVCDSGNGATSCLVGRFVHFIGPGHVIGPITPSPTSPSQVVVVQLIK